MKGLDVSAVVKHKEVTGSVAGFAGSQAIDNTKILELKVDVLIPSALENVITEKNAGKIQAKVVVELANGPTTPEADIKLFKRGIPVIPDILANAGGVTGSYFEWTQNIQQFTWKVERFNSELRDRLVTAFTDVNSFAKLHDCSLREAAYAIGLQRVSEATKLRGYLSGA